MRSARRALRSVTLRWLPSARSSRRRWSERLDVSETVTDQQGPEDLPVALQRHGHGVAQSGRAQRPQGALPAAATDEDRPFRQPGVEGASQSWTVLVVTVPS